jgi:hypothetical protein
MVEPLRHRQTKEAENTHVRSNAAAPHPYSTMRNDLLKGELQRVVVVRPTQGMTAFAIRRPRVPRLPWVGLRHSGLADLKPTPGEEPPTA